MNKVYLVDALRTPFGSFGGTLSTEKATDLAAHCMQRLLERADLQGEQVDEVIIGQVLMAGAGQGPARIAMRAANIPDQVPAMAINKVCGSGLKSLMMAADAIQLGNSEVVLAGGMENMSLAPYTVPGVRTGLRMGPGKVLDLMLHDALTDPYSGRHVGEVTEQLITSYGITREEMDDYALRSYQRSQEAINNGSLAEEISPYIIKSRRGDVTVAQDEEPFKVKFDKLASLRPVFQKDGTITAGNASTINDGAVMTLLASEQAVERYGLQPKARLIADASHSIHPDNFAEAPVGAIEKVCAKAGLKIADIGLFEINEAFAAVPLMAMRKHDLPIDKVNVNGGAVSIGHPLGASGTRLATTLVHEMVRRQERYGLATLCIGGGEAVACLFELV